MILKFSAADGPPAGMYTIKFEEIALKESTKDGETSDYWRWQFVIIEGEYKDSRLWVNTSPKVSRRSKAGKLVAAMVGREPIDGFSIDTDELRELTFMGKVAVNGEYVDLVPESITPIEGKDDIPF